MSKIIKLAWAEDSETPLYVNIRNIEYFFEAKRNSSTTKKTIIHLVSNEAIKVSNSVEEIEKMING